MVEFFMNLWNGIVAHSPEIITVITSSSFIGTVITILLSIRNKKVIDKNNLSNDSLNKTLSSSTDVMNTNNANNQQLVNQVNYISGELANLKAENQKISEQNALLLTKINSMLESQGLVWSTIKDETIRNTVSNIVTNAKYLETSNISDMKAKINDLEEKLLAKTEELKKDVENTVSDVKTTVNSVNNSIQNKLKRM